MSAKLIDLRPYFRIRELARDGKTSLMIEAILISESMYAELDDIDTIVAAEQAYQANRKLENVEI